MGFLENRFSVFIAIALLSCLPGCAVHWPLGKVEPVKKLIAEKLCEEIWPSSIYGQKLGNPEDITIDHSSGIAYISVLDFQGFKNADKNNNSNFKAGGIFRLNLEKDSTVLEPMTINLDRYPQKASEYTLFPHGISLFQAPGGPLRLFVVNKHIRKDENEEDKPDLVEIFNVNGNVLSYVDMAEANIESDDESSPPLLNMNDVAAVGPMEYYVTINTAKPSPSSILFGSGDGKVLFYSSGKYKIIAENLALANGIAASKSYGRLYVTDTLNGNFIVFSGSVDQGNLKRTDEGFSIDSSLDNVEWETKAEKHLLIGAHPYPFLFGLKSEVSSSVLSPSQILRKEVSEKGAPSISPVEEIFYNNGVKLSGSSVAARHGETLLIGSTTDRKLLRCELG